MSTINADSFEDLAQQCVMSDFQHRMLYVFVRVGSVEPHHPSGDDADDATMVQVLFDAHQPAAHGMTFESIRETADAHNATWNMIVVGLAKNSDTTLPDEAQAQAFLSDMREKIMIGAIDGFALLDRDGKAVDGRAEVVPVVGGARLN